jgi:hypothetical protein
MGPTNLAFSRNSKPPPLGGGVFTEDKQHEMSASWATAMRDFERTAALAAILLSPEIHSSVEQPHAELKMGYGSFFEQLDGHGASLQKARNLLVEAGRRLQRT